MPDFTAEDLRLINHFMDSNPHVKDGARIAKAILSSSTFPINSYDELTEALQKNGYDQLTMQGRSMPLSVIRTYIPSYYFPINSERDLLAKMTELQSRNSATVSPAPSPSESGVEIKWSTQDITLPPGVIAPKRFTHESALKLVEQSGKHNSGIAKLDQ